MFVKLAGLLMISRASFSLVIYTLLAGLKGWRAAVRLNRWWSGWGGRRSISVNVRVIAATHRNLESMLKNGTFREDLYYRLYVFPIEVPPLRDRRQDIPVLVYHFLEKIRLRLNHPQSPPLSPRTFAGDGSTGPAAPPPFWASTPAPCGTKWRNWGSTANKTGTSPGIDAAAGGPAGATLLNKVASYGNRGRRWIAAGCVPFFVGAKWLTMKNGA